VVLGLNPRIGCVTVRTWYEPNDQALAYGDRPLPTFTPNPKVKPRGTRHIRGYSLSHRWPANGGYLGPTQARGRHFCELETMEAITSLAF
jgi:hypothetical protein